MSTGQAQVSKLTNLSNIEGSDNILQSKTLGETLIVGKDSVEGTLGLLFDCETQLNEEFCYENNLYRHSEKNKDKTTVGYFEDSRRVRPIRLRGVRVSGFWIPLSCFDYIGEEYFAPKEGNMFNEWCGHSICEKYLPPQKKSSIPGQPKLKTVLSHMFKEHFKTEHLLRNLNSLPLGRFVVTAKLHGTSHRHTFALANKPLNFIEKLVNKFIPIQTQVWKDIVGSRTVVKSIEGLWKNPNNGYYKNDIWTQASDKFFKGKLLKGETVFTEIVGYDGTTPLMSGSDTKVLKSQLSKEEYKSFVEQFGERIEYNYALPVEEFDVYVYRITHTNEDGDSFDLGWEQLKKRCEKLGVKHVPEICEGRVLETEGKKELVFDWFPSHTAYATPWDDLNTTEERVQYLAANAHYNGTPAEGICLRVEDYPTCKIMRAKAQNFLVLECGHKDLGEVSLDEEN